MRDDLVAALEAELLRPAPAEMHAGHPAWVAWRRRRLEDPRAWIVETARQLDIERGARWPSKPRLRVVA